MRPFFLTLLFLFAPGVRAQTFVPGYVVAGGDTLRGEVALANEAANARGVRFRPAAGAEAVRYTPATATAFGADGGRRYRAGAFAPTYDAAPTGTDVAFARVVRSGAAALLAVERVDGQPLFFVQAGAAPVGLYLVRSEVPTGRGVRVREQRLYVQALGQALGPACALPLTDRTPYTEAALARVVDAYNACLDPSYAATEVVAVRRRVRLSAVEVGLGAVDGTHRRRVPRTAGEDPGISTVRASALAEVETPYAARALRLVAGADYEHTVARVLGPGFGNEALRMGVAHLRLGMRVVPAVRLMRAHAGVGLVVGHTIRRDAPLSDDPAERADLLRQVSSRDYRSSVGSYVEVGLGLASLPVDVVVRAQSTRFSAGVPAPAAWRFGTRTLSVGLVARL